MVEKHCSEMLLSTVTESGERGNTWPQNIVFFLSQEY